MTSSLEFRVWHKPTKVLYLVNFFILDQGKVWVKPKGSDTNTVKDHLANHPFNLDECIMMQYTGRLDEHGEKIWEGDVLRLDVVSDTPNPEEEYSQYSYVGFHNGGFAHFPIGEVLTEEGIDELNRFELFYLTSYDREGADLHRVACMHEYSDLLVLKGEHPLHTDATKRPE